MSEKKYLLSRFEKGLSVSDDGNFGYFKGYAITWDNVDRAGDVAVKGCFADTLEEKDKKIVMNWQHNYDEPIGSFPVMNEDDKGLYVEGRINLGTTRGREAYALLKAGDIDGLSIGYSIPEDGWEIKDGVRYLKQIDLYEISLVSTPCNPQAMVDSVKFDESQHPRDEDGKFTDADGTPMNKDDFKEINRSVEVGNVSDEGGGAIKYKPDGTSEGSYVMLDESDTLAAVKDGSIDKVKDAISKYDKNPSDANLEKVLSATAESAVGYDVHSALSDIQREYDEEIGDSSDLLVDVCRDIVNIAESIDSINKRKKKSFGCISVADIKHRAGNPRRLEKFLCDKGFSRQAAVIVASALSKKTTDNKLIELKRKKLALLKEKAELLTQIDKGDKHV